jgi:predicted nucleotidyltransferase
MSPQKRKKPRIKRETAERILKEVVQKVKKFNSSPESQFKYFVSKVLVFGSYLTQKVRLGDIDLAIQIERRWITDKEYDRLLNAVCGNKVLGDSRVFYPY